MYVCISKTGWKISLLKTCAYPSPQNWKKSLKQLEATGIFPPSGVTGDTPGDTPKWEMRENPGHLALARCLCSGGFLVVFITLQVGSLLVFVNCLLLYDGKLWLKNCSMWLYFLQKTKPCLDNWLLFFSGKAFFHLFFRPTLRWVSHIMSPPPYWPGPTECVARNVWWTLGI